MSSAIENRIFALNIVNKIKNLGMIGKIMNIRKMTIDDFENVYNLWLSTPNMGLNDMDDSKDGINKYLLRNPNTCFIAEKDKKIIGVILSGHDGRRGFIYHMTVLETEQRKGVGEKLLTSAMRSLEAEGISKTALVVFEKNQKGNSFWEKQGFTQREDLIYRNKAIHNLKRIDT